MSNLNIDSLIEAASKKLGVSPDELKNSLGNGDISSIAGKLSEDDRKKINAVMNNPALSEKFRKQFMKGSK